MEQLAKEGSALAGRWIWYDSAFSRDDDLLDEARGEHRDRISQDADRTSQDGDRVSDENPPTGDDAMSSHSSPGSSGTGSSEASEASSEPSSEPSSDPLDAEAAVVVKVPTQQPSGALLASPTLPRNACGTKWGDSAQCRSALQSHSE